MSIKDWPSAERPREKLLAKGAAALSDAELLAIFLRTGIKGKTAVDVARELLVKFGSLRALLMASQNEFCHGLGLGQAKYVQLQAVLEMSKRHLACNLTQGVVLNSVSKAQDFLSVQLRDKKQEVFAALFLDAQHRLIMYKELFYGSLESATVYPREVIKEVLKIGAAAVIFAHNHPSGNSEPSQADRQITTKLVNALGLIDVRVLDHCIIGNHVFSFAQNGLMPVFDA